MKEVEQNTKKVEHESRTRVEHEEESEKYEEKPNVSHIHTKDTHLYMFSYQ